MKKEEEKIFQKKNPPVKPYKDLPVKDPDPSMDDDDERETDDPAEIEEPEKITPVRIDDPPPAKPIKPAK